MSETVLISFCIPTYNRGEILFQTIKSYVNDPAFDDRVELVISDNCSTDNTQELVNEFLHYKNISYKRLPENIGAEHNMLSVLAQAKGMYLKLMNDTITLKPGALQKFLDIIQNQKANNKPIFFYQNIPFLNTNKSIHCFNINDLLSNVSYYNTWIGNFGAWKLQYEQIEDKSRYSHLRFPQTDWTFKLINRYGNHEICFGDFYSISELSGKGGYNIFEVFVNNYLQLLKAYKSDQHISKLVFNREKSRLILRFLTPWSAILLTRKKDFTFPIKNGFFIIMKEYWYLPVFYLSLFVLFYYLGFEIMKNTKRKLLKILRS